MGLIGWITLTRLIVTGKQTQLVNQAMWVSQGVRSNTATGGSGNFIYYPGRTFHFTTTSNGRFANWRYSGCRIVTGKPT